MVWKESLRCTGTSASPSLCQAADLEAPGTAAFQMEVSSVATGSVLERPFLEVPRVQVHCSVAKE